MFYSSLVDGVSPEGTLVRFSHEGTVTTPTNKITVQPLTPQSPYLFKISAVTPRGLGMEIIAEANTTQVDSDFGMKNLHVI